MTDADASNSLRQKHLDYIQALVKRLAKNSFLLRGWSISIVAAVLAFSKENSDWRFAVLALVPAVLFWFLDSFYLWQEMRFRALYDRVRLATIEQLAANPYFLNPEFALGNVVFPPKANAPREQQVVSPGTQWSAAWRPGLREFHAFLILMILFAAMYLRNV